MLAYDIITKKRDGHKLTKDEIDFMVIDYTKGSIPDYQMSAFLMAVFLKGMDDVETADLTMSMVNSGDIMDLSPISGKKVDKHSTGGVGDTTTLILAPLVAAAGVPMAKLSGRGLGHTGGTLDKLESIPGMRVDLSKEEFINQVKKINIAVSGQTGDLAPADKKMYALRDVTATVESIPLIASSIMSKKIAAGTDAILLDVKVGQGAFMKSFEDAKRLAQIMVNVGKQVNKDVRAIITDMNIPLASYIGNGLEVQEAVEILKGKHKGSPLMEISVTLAAHLLILAGIEKDFEKSRIRILEILESGKGYEKFKEMVKHQGGDVSYIEDEKKLSQASIRYEVKSTLSGIISEMNALKVGRAAMFLGAGRQKKEDIIDYQAGLIIHKRPGDKVLGGETLATLYANKNELIKLAEEEYISSVTIIDNTEKIQVKPLILETVV